MLVYSTTRQGHRRSRSRIHGMSQYVRNCEISLQYLTLKHCQHIVTCSKCWLLLTLTC